MKATNAPALRVFETRVPGLDQVLGGGLWEGGLYLMEGLPGTGKTILANQIAFAKARTGEKVLYISLISESHGKLVHHLSDMRFFDERLVGDGVYYVSGYRNLVDQGLQGLLEFITGQASEQRYSLIVLEGFSSSEYVKQHLLDLAEFLHRLNALAASIRSTIVLVSHDQGTDDHPEHTLVDGVFELTRVAHGMRVGRFLKVHKIRGRDPILGQHAFTITSDGIVVYPRLEAVATREMASFEPSPASGQRIPFGVPGLDEMLHGGLVACGATAILGVPGSGKTLLALKFLHQGLAAGERALFFGFNESPERLLRKAAAIGVDLRPWVERGDLTFLWQPPLEYALDELAWRLLNAVQEHRPKRVVIDGMKGFLSAATERASLSMFLTALTVRLRALEVDALVTEELPFLGGDHQEPPDLVAPIIENVLMVRHVELRGITRRFISVLKVRESGYDNAVKELVIADRGISVTPASRGAIGALDERSRG